MDFIAPVNPPALVTRWDSQLRTAGVLHRVAAWNIHLPIYYPEYKLVYQYTVYLYSYIYSCWGP